MSGKFSFVSDLHLFISFRSFGFDGALIFVGATILYYYTIALYYCCHHCNIVSIIEYFSKMTFKSIVAIRKSFLFVENSESIYTEFHLTSRLLVKSRVKQLKKLEKCI